MEDLFATLAGGKAFSKLDLAHAYSQIPLTDGSKQYVTVNTHKGLYQYNRLPFGVAAAPSIFQRLMENLLQGIPHVSIYLDDILITGTSKADHLSTLDKVFTRLEAAGLHLKRNKCAFLCPSVEYLGHKITADRLQPTEEKVRAIKEAPPLPTYPSYVSPWDLLTITVSSYQIWPTHSPPCIVFYRKLRSGHGEHHGRQHLQKQRDS